MSLLIVRRSRLYGLQEPFRWLGDVATIEAFESGVVDMKDFYFTGDDYRYRIEVDAKRRFLELLKAKFNAGARYKGKTWKWDTVILSKTQELARFLLGKSESLDFIEPAPRLEARDSRDLRERILALSVDEAGRSGIGRSTFHDLRQHATGERPLMVHKRVADELLRGSSNLDE